jgi:hypothetical protein
MVMGVLPPVFSRRAAKLACRTNKVEQNHFLDMSPSAKKFLLLASVRGLK